MPRIRFTADPKLPRDWAHLGFRKGDETDLSDDQANRWLRRGVAVVVPVVPKGDSVAALLTADETIIAAAYGSDSLSDDGVSGDSMGGADSVDAADSIEGAESVPADTVPVAGGRGRRSRGAA